ncbi:MAG: hypothetical protein ACJA06_001486 [Halocynthiibacter sp.]|jgi:hypothetical protein
MGRLGRGGKGLVLAVWVWFEGSVFGLGVGMSIWAKKKGGLGCFGIGVVPGLGRPEGADARILMRGMADLGPKQTFLNLAACARIAESCCAAAQSLLRRRSDGALSGSLQQI